ncbi:MAG: hypothetical protein QXG01_04585 [Candidatus Bathyarchaeia archaeon]
MAIFLVGAVALGYYSLKLHFTWQLVAVFILQLVFVMALLSLIPQRILIPSIIVTLIASIVIYSRALYEFLRRRYA